MFWQITRTSNLKKGEMSSQLAILTRNMSSLGFEKNLLSDSYWLFQLLNPKFKVDERAQRPNELQIFVNNKKFNINHLPIIGNNLLKKQHKFFLRISMRGWHLQNKIAAWTWRHRDSRKFSIVSKLYFKFANMQNYDNNNDYNDNSCANNFFLQIWAWKYHSWWILRGQKNYKMRSEEHFRQCHFCCENQSWFCEDYFWCSLLTQAFRNGQIISKNIVRGLNFDHQKHK